jgi:hypothetical protein
MALSPVARLALEEHLPMLREGAHALRHGWQVDMDWDAGLCHVRLSCPYVNGDQSTNHIYVLRLSFEYYPLEQPGVIFVNARTREVGSQADFERWWPNIDGNPWINIQINGSDPGKSYLCFQWTQEFKQTHSAPEQSDPKKWDPEKHNVVGVVSMVQKALLSRYYKGHRKTS